MIQQVQKKYDGITGYAFIFSLNDWEELNCIINNILSNGSDIFETPKQGDSRREYVDLDVARFVIRKDGHSDLVNEPYSLNILNIFKRTNFIELIERKTNLENLKILRMQLNCMKANSFVGAHIDCEHDSSYKVTAIIRTISSHSGGELYLYGDHPQIIKQENNSIFLMDSLIEHEVKTVIDGYRNTLVVVLG